MKLYILPIDVVMFRDSRPFTAGEDIIAHSIVPLPQTFAGAIRTKIYFDKIDGKDENDEKVKQYKEFIGFCRDEPQFTIMGTFLAKNYEELFFAPTNLAMYIDSKNKKKWDFLYPLEIRWGLTSRVIFGGHRIGHKEVKPLFFTKFGLKKYLMGEFTIDDIQDDNKNEKNVVQQEDIFTREERIGIALEKEQKITREGLLYRVEFIRFKDSAGFSIWTDDSLDEYFENTGLIKIGGENRVSRYIKVAKGLELYIDANELSEIINREKKFLVYVATHTIISKNNGKDSRIYTWNIKKEVERLLKIRITAIYPVVNKLRLVSGWDVAKHIPKPTRYAISPGSVYFIKFDGKIELNSPFGKIGELQKLGYGLIMFGVWR
ncbi:MAG: type III-B CRISPR module-associated protein Cmr3 [Candidatus Odinarchaeota archaeon]|nr:type III-B CRISPR module-associated protein Cmr3 [Candidatus Odinarchaeota archaeon]